MALHTKKKNSLPKDVVKQKLREKKKISKQLLKAKRARLLVKNLPFKATEENLKEYFQQYGEISSVDILKKPNGKLVGCGFIQFKLVQKAAKAKHHTDGKLFLGRPISVDFAKPKDKYKSDIKTKSEVDKIKEENETKSEPIDVDETKPENDDAEIIHESNSENEDAESDINFNELNERKPHVISHDVVEGKTVFVKNVPFEATSDNLKECMLPFGPIYYALICFDKLTEHSKGTAFVKFVNKEDADKALSAGTELTLLGNILDCHPALDQKDVQRKIEDKRELKKEPKDSRNLYLVKEGVVLAGTKAAEGVSASDMAKRLQIEQYKTQMLRNLNMFVSKERLVVHNLPATWDDKKLRTLLHKYGGPNAIIKEARIMRDMKILDAKGLGKSKEFGFVTFTKHENALAALRNLNNNPDIFSAHKRPIIAFSIENKTMISARQRRLEKSRKNNPTSKTYDNHNAGKVEKKNPTSKTFDNHNAGKVEKKSDKMSRKPKLNKVRESDDVQGFSGVTSTPGSVQKMRSRYKLTVQAKLHHENLKKEKRKQKFAKKTLAEKKKDFIKQPQQKINKVKEMDNFSKLVNEYKKKLMSASTPAKSKWYK